MHLFIDTGALIARVIARDQYHERSLIRWSEISKRKLKLLSTKHVFDETVTLLARRTSYSFAAGWADRHLRSKAIHWESTTEKDHTEAVTLMRKFADQCVSHTDTLSFTVMKRHAVKNVFGFDRHFNHAGFKLWEAE